MLCRAVNMINDSVDDSINCFNKGLLEAADCMKRKIYTGPRNSKWFDCECKAAKRETRKWWRCFKRSKCEDSKRTNRLKYVECRKSYRTLIQSKRQKFKQDKLTSLASKVKDTKMFWREVKSIQGKTSEQPSISSTEWFEHFKDVHGSEANREHIVFDEYPVPPSMECLDKPISQNEIRKAIGNLKLNKAPGPDCVLGEMLKYSIDQILPFLMLLFNHIFDSGQYPTVWNESIIVPIHKNGDRNNPTNYRGVSLLSVLGKMFTQIINKRLTEWAEENNKIVEEQSGFRAEHSTVDNIFVLYSLVQKYLLKKSGKVYICFVDFKKAFDTINRSILWNILKKAGVGGKMLQVLQNMYREVRSCVRCLDGLTELFECHSGVRQGCVLSPLLFSFFVNELALDVAANGSHGIQLNPDIVHILILLFADDVILASYSVGGLQKQIDILKRFADTFEMNVNMSKTKIIVFRKGGFLASKESWRYGKEKLEVVNSYKYLGLIFTTKLSVFKMVEELATKAKTRTCQLLRCLWRLGTVQRNVFFNIYDAQILPILMYGSELWGYQRMDALEKAHLFACKRYLNVRIQTPNNMIYGDLGRYPLFITSAIRCLRYWIRITKLSEDRLPKKAYNMMLGLQNTGKKTWAFQVKNLLYRNGFGVVWQHQGVGDARKFITAFRQCLFDQYQQDWNAIITSKERFEMYSSFKHTILAEKYTDFSHLFCFKKAYIQFRFGISPLHIHNMRYRKDISPHNLLCPLCKVEIEDESHVLFYCKGYREFRENMTILNGIDYRRDVSDVMACDDEETVFQLSRFLYKVFLKRKEYQ